jgi:hypothetical protein
VCRRLLRPLEQISLQLARIRKRQFSGNLPTPWLRELQEVVVSINQLVSERKRDLLQQRLKITQLGKHDALPTHQKLVGLVDTDGNTYQQHFFSTQGSIRLYSRLLPKPPPPRTVRRMKFGGCSTTG